ncbi:hypothetical protein [Nocardia higoensis]|uniref:hypothetical protein n=1 Tax=Nocardia higoensis TaxID=228599 RepID=UPI0005950315|nr:hypothetical protein [Nocardia higoensis]
MTDNTEAQLKTWQTFKEQGINGQFKLETAVGEALVGHCDAFLLELERMRGNVENIRLLAGYGGLPSAIDLKTKFEQKAVGGGTHDPNDNALARIDQHIEIVTTMRDAYKAAIGKLEAVDQETGQTVTNQGDQIN